MKSVVYHTEEENAEQLRNRIEDAAEEMRNNPDLFHRIRRSSIQRVHLCIDGNGNVFEHLSKLEGLQQIKKLTL